MSSPEDQLSDFENALAHSYRLLKEIKALQAKQATHRSALFSIDEQILGKIALLADLYSTIESSQSDEILNMASEVCDLSIQGTCDEPKDSPIEHNSNLILKVAIQREHLSRLLTMMQKSEILSLTVWTTVFIFGVFAVRNIIKSWLGT